ncbi:ECs1072 family phage-associated protein [Pseudomonas batumici]|uniref:ECs1072 family phage-associated protein n=1 Tax=Pseudomonas batumici TaxID=226910 RepID=UPI003BAED858
MDVRRFRGSFWLPHEKASEAGQMNDIRERYWNFFNTINSQVEAVRGGPGMDLADINKIKNRSYQIYRMEIYLRDYRAKHAHPWESLTGVRAAHHRILAKFHWPIPAIEMLTVEQIFFALHDDIANHPIGPAAEQALANYGFPDMPTGDSLQGFLEKEWLPEIAARLLPKAHL